MSNLFNNPYYQQVARGIGISSFDSENDIRKVKDAARQAGIEDLSSQGEVDTILSFRNSAPAVANDSDFKLYDNSALTPNPNKSNEGTGSIDNPQNRERVINDKLQNYLIGMDPDFVRQVTPTIPSGISELGPRAWENFTGTLDKTYDLYKEKKLTDLRGQISKELAEMYNETEISKSKIAARSAMDVQRQSGLDAFRTGMKQSYSQILANL